MALDLTIGEIAAELRLSVDPTVAPAEPYLSILIRHRASAERQIDSYAPNAPNDAKAEAAIRYIGYILDRPTSYAGTAFADVWRHSGAQMAVSDWHDPVIVESGVPFAVIADTDAPETTISPSHPVNPGTHYRYMGWSDGLSIDQAELDAAARFTSDVLTVPARVGNGHIFAGFPTSEGAPDSVYLDGNPTNQLPFWQRQTLELQRDNEGVLLLVSVNLLSAALAGRMWTWGYSSP